MPRRISLYLFVRGGVVEVWERLVTMWAWAWGTLVFWYEYLVLPIRYKVVSTSNVRQRYRGALVNLELRVDKALLSCLTSKKERSSALSVLAESN